MTARVSLILGTTGAHRSCEKIGIKHYSPPCITARRGGCVINKISRSHQSRRSRGGFPFVLNRKTTPASRSRRLRDILLIARPPLLAVMQGGEYAGSKHWGFFHSSQTAATAKFGVS